MLSDSAMRLLERINLTAKPLGETWLTLPEPDQWAWQEFFVGYVRNICHLTDLTEDESTEVCGAFAHIWALAHEYHRLYGPLWK
ncbi:hypothetical protein ES703_122265 [subsurface metagenome]